jgi:hypothetical protein
VSALKKIVCAVRHPFHRVDYSVLFILRKRDHTWGQPYSYNSSGLLNSATFVEQMLVEHGVRAKVVTVQDSNEIDREVYQFNPDIVVLEAIWCPPSKLRELAAIKHHQHRKWVVRNHSELPFLAMEGFAIAWILEYAQIRNTYVSCNSPVANFEISEIIHLRTGMATSRVLFLPNYYPTAKYNPRPASNHRPIDIGCFGAIRPLKNQLIQATAAMIFARAIGRPLRFHINATRIEGQADPILRSLRAIFDHAPGYVLVEHPWMDRKDFLLLCRQMDLGLQVSLSESFNLTSADLVLQGVPVVGSSEIPWLPELFHADPTSAASIVRKMHTAREVGAKPQFKALKEYSDDSSEIWLTSLQKLVH